MMGAQAIHGFFILLSSLLIFSDYILKITAVQYAIYAFGFNTYNRD